MYIKTIEPNEATGEIAELYNAEIASMGRVMEATQCWSARPDIIVPVEALLHQIRDGFSLSTWSISVSLPLSRRGTFPQATVHTYISRFCRRCLIVRPRLPFIGIIEMPD